MNDIVHTRCASSLAMYLGPHTTGYAFAYAAAIRADATKLDQAEHGGTFGHWFWNLNRSDDEVSRG